MRYVSSLGGRTSASAGCRHWSGRAVRWSSSAILLSSRKGKTTEAILSAPTVRLSFRLCRSFAFCPAAVRAAARSASPRSSALESTLLLLMNAFSLLCLFPRQAGLQPVDAIAKCTRSVACLTNASGPPRTLMLCNLNFQGPARMDSRNLTSSQPALIRRQTRSPWRVCACPCCGRD